MATLRELYTYYCRRWDCRPNSAFCTYLDGEDKRSGGRGVLRSVDVSRNYLGKNGIMPVLDLVKNVKTVEYLDASNNRLEHEQLEHLVYCLLLHPTIRTVILRDNCLHDGSLDHIVNLLQRNNAITTVDLAGNSFLPASIARVDECLEFNKIATAKRQEEDKALAIHLAELNDKRASFSATVSGSLTQDTSGGYLHFATWWRNPQYRVCVSRRSRVKVLLETTQNEATKGTKQIGVVVLHFDGTRRVIELGPRTVLAESDIAPTDHCSVEVELEATGEYVVVPFTFQPRRVMDFSLTVTALPDETAVSREEGWITLELLDERYDWFVQSVTGSWTAGREGGGRSSLPTWRYNPMFRLQYSGRPNSHFWSAPADVHVLLYKAIDADMNDDKEIGLDVVEHDSSCHGLPPLICTPDQIHCSHPHQHRTSIMSSFSVPASSLDLFLVPSTKEAGQAGDYTLVVFSGVPFEVTQSSFPHGWNHRVVEGAWDADHCGGCRDLYASWKNNIAFKVMMRDEEGTSAGEDAAAPKEQGRTSSVVVACLENAPAPPSRAHTESPAATSGLSESTEGTRAEVDPEELRAMEELAAFKERHHENAVEMCLAAMEDAPPTFPVLRSSVLAVDEAQLVVPDTGAGQLLLVPMTRHAGQFARYRLHLFCARSFIVADSETVVEREREWQLAVYARENEARRSAVSDAMATGQDREDEADIPGTTLAGLPEFRGIVAQRDAVVTACEASGYGFSDRDFPRGTSSLWLEPEAKQPFDFPKEYTWRRVSELAGDVVTPADPTKGVRLESPPFPYGKRAWFASIVHAVATKPHWLANMCGGYSQQHGFAQFRFFKGGKWIGVTVDDFLPVDAAGQLCMGHASGTEDYLFPLMEKAFAKLHRCYEALELKVTPDLTLVDVFRQALEDVSGGVCTVYHLRTNKMPMDELTDEERNTLWRKMKEASKSNALHTLMLRSNCPGAGERKHGGVLPDHLYGIVDARFVEQQRLVKLRNWSDGEETVWKGHWVAESPEWTDTLRTALEYDETTPATGASPQVEFWLSFDEVLHYFSDLLVTEQPTSHSFVAGNFGDAEKTYAEDTEALLRAPQFALQVTGPTPGCAAVEVTVGLHRADARMSVTRDKHAIAKYKHALGMAVLATHDNRRHVKRVEDSQVLRLQTPVRVRDVYFKLLLDPTLLNRQLLTLTPFREHEKDTDTPFLVSARSSNATVTVSRVDDNAAVRLEGEWPADCVGGPPQAVTWRDNPQFLLYPSESMEVTITLARDGPTGATDSDIGSIGFTVHSSRSCRSFIHFQQLSVVAHVPGGPPPSNSALGTVRLVGMAERRGMPYVLVPYCSNPGTTGPFTLTVVGNKPMRLTNIEPRLDWQRVRHSVSMRADDGSAGGSPRFPSWRCSPQVVMEFPVARTGRVFITATNRNVADDRNAIGLMLLRGDGDKHFGGNRRRLLFDLEDVVAISEESLGRTQLEVDVSAVRDKRGDGGEAAPLILAVYTAMPYKEVDVDLAFYSEVPVHVGPVREWKYTALEEGGWELGQTAGGNRREYGSWVNNPFVGLATVRPTSVVALLVQYPRVSEQPIVKRLGKKKAYLPPPITNPDRRMTVELDLVHHDDTLTTVAGTGPTRDAETAIAIRLEATSGNQPYIFVPVTTVADKDADYKLFIYADQPIDLFTVEKERIWYT